MPEPQWHRITQQLPPDGATVLVVANSWPNSFNGPQLLLGEYFATGKINGRAAHWRVVDLWGDYREPYQFLPDAALVLWAPLPQLPAPLLAELEAEAAATWQAELTELQARRAGGGPPPLLAAGRAARAARRERLAESCRR